MSAKRLLLFAAIAFGVFFLVQSPEEAAKLVKQTGESVGELMGTAASSLSRFVKSLV